MLGAPYCLGHDVKVTNAGRRRALVKEGGESKQLICIGSKGDLDASHCEH
jgi:hypothetical protein